MRYRLSPAADHALPLPGTLSDVVFPGAGGPARIARDVALIVAGSLLVALFAQIG